MVEKEAEKHCNDVLCSVCENPTCTEHLKCREWRDRRAGFYCGAVFGYNKANEWHYVKDGKYPTDEKDVEVLYQDCDKINVYNCIYDIQAENWLYYKLDNMLLELFPFNVIAWKELDIPKDFLKGE